MPSSSRNDLYTRAGIADVGEFYRTKFVSEEVLDPRYFRALDRFDLRFARTMWIFDNVRANSSVLELGCGTGMLALLKRKGVFLTGVDLSSECALAARRNGYDVALAADLSYLPFPDGHFDYVVSLDVLGHVDFEDKNGVLAEIRRVLRPDGVTMHGIECIDRQSQQSYDKMSPEELRRFVEIDGHVGLEEEQEHAARFRHFFQHVAWEPRYTLCLSSVEFLKQADEYGLTFEPDFIDYLRNLSFKERRAFDMAMGYVFGKISDLHIQLPKSGLYVFLKAANVPLGAFYNEHRDRHELLSAPGVNAPAKSFCLDRSAAARFDDGWFDPNSLPPIARWMGTRGGISFRASRISRLNLDLTTHIPDLRAQPIGLEILLNGVVVSVFSLFRYGWFTLSVTVPEALNATGSGEFRLEIRASRTWQPRPVPGEARDDRELSIAVCNILIQSED